MRDHQAKLDDAGIKAFGISYDDGASHTAFRQKFGLTTPLLLDTDKKIGALYGLNVESYPDRWTFVIGRDGKIADILKKIEFDNHGSQIISALSAENKSAS